LSVKVEYRGKQKTFHVENFGRTLPDIDVTDDVLNDEGEIEFKKLISQAQELIDEVKDKVTKEDMK
jgi:hypothetical protein